MRKFVWLIIIFFTFAIGINAQCSAGSVCVSQSTIDSASAAITELIAARDVIKKFEAERVMTTAERTAAQVLIKNLNDVIDVRGRIIGEYESMIKLYKSVIDMQGQIIERLEKQLMKGKSGWQKFVGILEKVVLVLAGAGLSGL